MRPQPLNATPNAARSCASVRYGARARQPGEVIELSRENALSVVQTESKENASGANEQRRVEGRSCPEFDVRVLSMDRIASSFGLLVIHPERALRWESLPRADFRRSIPGRLILTHRRAARSHCVGQ